MKIGILGTGMVGQTLGTKLAQRGHDVKMGSREANNPKASEWVKTAGGKSSNGTFHDAAKFGELIFNCTAGAATIAALNAAGAENLANKIVVDISNGLDTSKGMPPTLIVDVSKDSLGEQIQKTFPQAKVVKTLNTLTAALMVNPGALPGDHTIFLSGNDAAAKSVVAQLLEQDFGWKKSQVLDFGDISTARGQEALVIPWLRLWGKFGTPMFNWHVQRPTK